jgi:hypothetical protein
MPFRKFLRGSSHSFDPEAMSVMGVAYELVRAAFGYRGVKIDDDTIADKVIANKIIELAKAGERNSDCFANATTNKPPLRSRQLSNEWLMR